MEGRKEEELVEEKVGERWRAQAVEGKLEAS